MSVVTRVMTPMMEGATWTTTLLIIILLVLVLFGGGYGRRRWHGRRRS